MVAGREAEVVGREADEGSVVAEEAEAGLTVGIVFIGSEGVSALRGWEL